MCIDRGRYKTIDGKEIYDVKKWIQGLDLICVLCGSDELNAVMVYPHEYLAGIAKSLMDDTEVPDRKTEPHFAHLFPCCAKCFKESGEAKVALPRLAAVPPEKLECFHVDTTARLVFHSEASYSNVREAFKDLPVKVNKNCFEIVEPGHLYFTNPIGNHVSIFPEQRKMLGIKRCEDHDDTIYFGDFIGPDADTLIPALRQEKPPTLEWLHELVWARILKAYDKRMSNKARDLVAAIMPGLLGDCDCPDCQTKREE